MTSHEQFHRVAAIFEAAREQSPEQRTAFLEAQCAGDVALREEVQALLQCHDDAGGVLNDTDLEAGRKVFSGSENDGAIAPIEFDAGTVIGNYRLVRCVGEGGMGVVYEAEQLHPIQRAVALKLIRSGLNTKALTNRLESERQALAMMTHPNVAAIFEAGVTEAGQPYFVLEYVDGQPITTFCDTHSLSIRSRLELFLTLCDAIHHAHQKGIIHRDIKPSNVLVSGRPDAPTLKVIDFGVAKAIQGRLTDATVLTAHGQLIGTPAYMSPEQITSGPASVDIRSDVYSLGVLLYELLVGRTPLDETIDGDSSFAQICRAICEHESDRPSSRLAALGDEVLSQIVAQRSTTVSSLVRDVRGDLDWITLRALEKNPERRYSAVTALGDDVRRHLRDEPVSASPPGRVYRMRKFARRHRAGAAAGCAIALTVVLGVTAVLVQAQRIKAEAETTNDVSQFIERMLTSIDPARAQGEDVTVRSIVDDAAVHLEQRLQDRPLVRARLHNTLGITYRAIGEYEPAQQQLQRAIELYEHHADLTHPIALRAANNLALLLSDRDRLDEAEALARKSLKMAIEQYGDSWPTSISLLTNLGVILDAKGRKDEAAELYHKAMTLSRNVHGETDDATINNMNNYGLWLMNNGRLDEAAPLLEQCLALRRETQGEQHPATITALSNLGTLRQRQGRPQQALQLIQEAVKLDRRVRGEAHPKTLGRIRNLAVALSLTGDHAQAVTLLRDTMPLARKRLGTFHATSMLLTETLTAILAMNGQLEQAERLALAFYDEARETYGDDHAKSRRVALLLSHLYEQWEKPELQDKWLARSKAPSDTDADDQPN